MSEQQNSIFNDDNDIDDDNDDGISGDDDDDDDIDDALIGNVDDDDDIEDEDDDIDDELNAIDNNVQNEEIIDDNNNDDEDDDDGISGADDDDDIDDEQQMINDEADDEAAEEEEEDDDDDGVDDMDDMDDDNKLSIIINNSTESQSHVSSDEHNNSASVNAMDTSHSTPTVTSMADTSVAENDGVYQWSAFTGLRVKTFSAQELTAFRKPFELGWKREVVLRGTVTSSGKKIGDVYYFSSDKKTKLRSYVEMGLFLKRNPTSGLVPENFTFARQPIFRPPAEIVRHAMQRGGGQHAITPTHIIDSSPFTPIANNTPTTVTHVAHMSSTPNAKTERSARNSTASESEEQFSMSIAEGRAKRKRVAPSRFEDEDYSESSPFKKKSKSDKSGAMSGGLGGSGLSSGGASHMSSLVKSSSQMRQQNSSQNSSNSSKTQLSIQEKRRQLQHQLLQQVHEQNLRKQQLQNQHNNGSQQQQHVSHNTHDNSEHTSDANDSKSGTTPTMTMTSQQSNARKSIQSGITVKVEPNGGLSEDMAAKDSNSETMSGSVTQPQQSQSQQCGVPCSMSCAGRRGMLPNLMCSRCFCLYHLDCVPGGVFLREPRVFVCPNCLKPEDTQQEEDIPSSMTTTNGHREQERDVTEALKSFSGFIASSLVTTTTTASQPHVSAANAHLKASRHVSTFAPILPKPPQLTQQTNNSGVGTSGGIATQAQHFKQHNRKMSMTSQQQQQCHTSVNQCSLPVARVETGNTGLPKEAMNVKLPAGTHLYRVVSSGPNGHSMIVKNKAMSNPSIGSHSSPFKPMFKNARKSSHSAMTSSVAHALSQQRNANQTMHRNVNTNNYNNGTSRVSHKQQSFYTFPEIAPIAPIGPIKMTNKQLQQFLEPSMFVSNRPNVSMRAHVSRVGANTCSSASLQNSLLAPYQCLNKVLSFCSALDLVRLKRVCRSWHALSSQPFLWRHISLKGVNIADWLYLARNIIETNATVELDFDGIRCGASGTSDELCDTWRNFATIVDYLRSVNTLKFGAVPTFVLEEISSAAITDNCYNSFSNLQFISVRNLFEEESPSMPCSLSFLEQFHCLPQLKSLHLNAKNGLTVASKDESLLTRVFTQLTHLQTLVITSLKDFSSEQFVFLESLKALKHLEIGSCQQWFTQNDTDNAIITEESGENNDSNAVTLNGAFKYLSQLTQLKTLRLVDVTIDDNNRLCSSLPLTLQSLSRLESLTMDNLRIDTCGTQMNDLLIQLKSLSLRLFALSSSEPQTNRYVFDLLKKLDNCHKILWKVDTVVEDSGECFIPFKKIDGEEVEESVLLGIGGMTDGEDSDMIGGDSDVNNDNVVNNNNNNNNNDGIKYMDLTFLNELLQSELANTFIEIKPN